LTRTPLASTFQIETLRAGACPGIAALIALETGGVCCFKLQPQKIVEVLFVMTGGQWGAAVRLHRHLIVGQLSYIPVSLRNTLAEHRAEPLPGVVPVAKFAISKPSPGSERWASEDRFHFLAVPRRLRIDDTPSLYQIRPDRNQLEYAKPSPAKT
jgi:hypothetical protein